MDKSTPFTHPPEGYGAQKRIRDLINHAAQQKAEIERLDLQLQEMTANKAQCDDTIMRQQAEIERLQEKVEADVRYADWQTKMYQQAMAHNAKLQAVVDALKQIEVRGLEIINEHVGGSDASYVAQELTSMALAALKEADG